MGLKILFVTPDLNMRLHMFVSSSRLAQINIVEEYLETLVVEKRMISHGLFIQNWEVRKVLSLFQMVPGSIFEHSNISSE